MSSCEFCKIFKNTVFNRTPPVAVSVECEEYINSVLYLLTGEHLEKVKWSLTGANPLKSNLAIIRKSVSWFANQLNDIPMYRSSRPEVFLRRRVLKICSKFTGEHPCRSWNRTSAWVFPCIFSEHFFLRTPLEGCFSIRHYTDLSHLNFSNRTDFLSSYLDGYLPVSTQI